MKIFKLSSLILLILLFASCDPAQNIYFINKTNSETKVKINLLPETEIKNSRLKSVATNDSIVYKIKPNETGDLYFGMGTWSEDEIGELVAEIKSIEIETEDKKTIYKSQKAIEEILSKNREGLIWQTEINIEIE